MNSYILPSINNLPLQNLSIINLPPLKLMQINSKLFYCKDCPKRFNSKNSLIRHLRVHAGIKPYSCKICCKSFSRKDILARHKESVKCIKKTEAFNSQQIDIASDSENEPLSIPFPGLIHSRMSISSLVSDNSGSVSEPDEYRHFTDYKLFDVNYSPLVLPSQLVKSNFFQNSDDSWI